MMPAVPCSEPAKHRGTGRVLACAVGRQRGSMLLEALVGVVLSASLGLGMAYAAARALSTQRYQSTQTMAVMAMRTLLSVPSDLSSWCTTGSGTFAVKLNNVDSAGASASASSNTVRYTLTCSTVTPTITGASQSAATSLRIPSEMSTDGDSIATALFGGDGKVTFSP